MSVEISDYDLYLLLISETRYAMTRENHLAPGVCCDLVKKYIPQMNLQWQSKAAEQLMTEIIEERSIFYNSLSKDSTWEDLLIFLLDYITVLPHNVDKYDRYIYSRLVLNNHNTIDWTSPQIAEKILYNKNRLLKETTEGDVKND